MRQGVVYLNKERVALLRNYLLTNINFAMMTNISMIHQALHKPDIDKTTTGIYFPLSISFFCQHAVRRAQPHRSGKIIAD